MFYGHLTLSRDFGLLSPYPAFYSIVCMGNLFPTRGSHNIIGCAICLLLSQCFLQSLIYCPVFPGVIHCTDLRRPTESLLISILFCRLLQHFHYSRFIPLPTIPGHVAKLPTMVAHPISPSSSVDVHCIWVSLWTCLISSSERIFSGSSILSCMRNSCPLGYMSSSSSI